MQKQNVKAKKQFGQNFLNDHAVLNQIIEAMPHSDSKIAEIGPGLGDLTKLLVDVKSVEAFEVDPDLCKHLNHAFHDAITTGRLTLHCGDVLSHWESELLDEPYALVANLPYYIATHIILKALADPRCEMLLVMVQREVAEKLSAAPGDRNFGALSVIAQSVAETAIIVIVPPEAFVPPPKVDSAVIRLIKHAHRNDAGFEAMLAAAFSQPRKTLAKNLSVQFGKEAVTSALMQCGLGASVRPHQVSTTLYHQLYDELKRSLDDDRRESARS